MASDVPPENEPQKKLPWRPTKYHPSMCERAVELGAEGASIEEIAFELGICPKTIHTYMDVHEDFLHAMTRAKAAELVWWERKGRNSLEADKFQVGVWSKSMSCRFPSKYREKTAVVGGDKDDNPIKQEHTHRNIDAILSRVSGIAARIGEDRDPKGTDGD